MTVTGVNRVNRAEDAYRVLRERIVFGDLLPNAVLVEADLAAELGTSRTPVREAFQRLATDQLIVSRRRRWYVRDYDWNDVEEVYQVRSGHEGLAARLAAGRPAEETHDRLAAVRARALEDRHLSDGREWVVANDRFHSEILAMAGNARLVDIVDRSKVYYFSRAMTGLYSDPDRDRSTREHLAIVDAIADGDVDRAEQAARDHVLAALEILRTSGSHAAWTPARV